MFKSYTYNADNQLESIKEPGAIKPIVRNYYTDGRVTSQLDALDSTFTYSYDTTSQLTTLIDNQGQVEAMKRNGKYYYYQTNAHGDVISLTDSSGTVVVNSYTYDPWGSPVSTSETIANPYRYAGYRWDADTGLYYLNKRYYSPDNFRFLTTDIFPANQKNPQTINNYLYALNNPINYDDPLGLSPKRKQTFWNSIKQGEYFGTTYGENSLNWYAQRYNDTGKWYYALGGGLSALWTSNTWWNVTGFSRRRGARCASR